MGRNEDEIANISFGDAQIISNLYNKQFRFDRDFLGKSDIQKDVRNIRTENNKLYEVSVTK